MEILETETQGCFCLERKLRNRAHILSLLSVGSCLLPRLAYLCGKPPFFYAIIQIVFNPKPSELWDQGFRAYKWPLALLIEPQNINISALWCTVSSFAAYQAILNLVP